MEIWRKVIRIADSLVNLIIAALFIPLLLYGIYAVWDSQQVYKHADASLYETYRPAEEDDESLAELQSINPEVFGWLVVDDTHIDYPLVQGEYNSKYVNTDVKGNFSLAGSIFLDCRNEPGFSDVNSVIYGHHMQKDAMFGELEFFEDQDFFNNHPNGKVFYQGAWHSIAFFAFLETDAYDPVIFNAELSGPDANQIFLDSVKDKALNYRNISLSPDEHYITLSTCTSDSTNGRHILVGRIDQVPESGSEPQGGEPQT